MHLARHSVFTVILAGSLITATTSSADVNTVIDRATEAYLQGKPYAAVVIGVVDQGGGRVFGYGSVTLNGRSREPDGRTLFELCSTTKLFTGTLLAVLVDEGKVSLDDSALEYLPPDIRPPSPPNREISLLDLATHRSGLPEVILFLGVADPGNPYANLGRDELNRVLSRLEIERDAGSKFEYSNLGVGLLGEALANADSIESFERLVIEKICDPLEMNDTRIGLSADQSGRFAPGYDATGQPTLHWTFASLHGAMALKSTADDMLAFAAANLGLTETHLHTSMERARQPRANTENDGLKIGLCWFNWENESADSVVQLHNGVSGGHRSFIGLAPRESIGVVVLSNTVDDVEPLGIEIIETLKSSHAATSPDRGETQEHGGR